MLIIIRKPHELNEIYPDSNLKETIVLKGDYYNLWQLWFKENKEEPTAEEFQKFAIEHGFHKVSFQEFSLK